MDGSTPRRPPPWLAGSAERNPLSATATAVRDLLGSPGWESTGWASDHAPLLAVPWPLVLLVVFVPLAIRRYVRLGR